MIKAFDNKLEKFMEADIWNLRREDCFALKINVEVGIHE